MNGNWSVNSVTFNNTSNIVELYSSTASTLTLGAGGITNNDADAQFVNHAITLSAAQTWNAAAGLLLINGAVNNGGNLLTIDSASGELVYIQGALSGSGGLTKNGLGWLQLDNGKTYTGTTTINAGSMGLDPVATSAGVVQISGALNIGDGVGLGIDTLYNGNSEKVANSATVSIFSTGAWRVAENFGLAPIIETITNLNVVSTGIFGGGVVYIDYGSFLNVHGTVTMTGGMVTTVSGGGTLWLNGGLNTNGSSVVASISTQLDLIGGTRTFTVADGAVVNDLDVTGVVSNGGIIKNGLGALRLGAANTYAGGTTINAGTILIGHDSALGIGLLTVNGGTLQADGAARTIMNAVANGSFGVDGAFDLTLNFPLNLTGDITKNGAGALIFA
jgi:fibronectin-binding autotransporter adhesin